VAVGVNSFQLPSRSTFSLAWAPLFSFTFHPVITPEDCT
jgi:hypothetical protein